MKYLNFLYSLLFLTQITFADSILLPTPQSTESDLCQKVTDDAFSSLLSLTRTFFSDFNNFDLYDGKWSPHYDGGFDQFNKKWLGYDWVTKRTLPQEQQIYVDPEYHGLSDHALGLSPFSIKSSKLIITANQLNEQQKKLLGSFDFYSGLLTTRKSFVQKYGYFEIDAKVPQLSHLLPAFWLLPFDKSWPPEIDVFEAPGHIPNTIVTTIHKRDSSGVRSHTGCNFLMPDYDKNFHKFGVLWKPDNLTFYIDRKPVSYVKTPDSFTKPMYMLVNIAVGGVWVGKKVESDGMPVSMIIRDIGAYSISPNPICIYAVGGVKQCQGI
jgi:beta-glucanase (GH16 family)